MSVFSFYNVFSILSTAFLIIPVNYVNANPVTHIQFAANTNQQNDTQELAQELTQELSPWESLDKKHFDEFKIQREQIAAEARRKNNIQEQLLWDLLGKQRFDEFKIELERAQANLPNWRPPVKMLQTFREGYAATRLKRVTTHIKRATDDQDWATIDRLASQYPAQFNCDNVHNMWTFALAQYKLKKIQNSVSSYRKIIKQCDANQTLIITLQRASAHLTEEQTETLIIYYNKLDNENINLNPDVRQKFDTLRYGFYTTWMTKHVDEERFSTAINYSEKIETDIINRKDAKVSNIVGWTYFKIKQFDDASFWFDKSAQWMPSDEAQLGLALIHFEKKNLRLADFHLNKMKNRGQRSDGLTFEIQMVEASKAYSDENYSGALSILSKLDSKHQADRRVLILRAWSLFQLELYAKAEEQFIPLYEADLDQETAQGVFFSAAKRNDFKQVKTLVTRTDGPLDKMWHEHLAEKLYDQKKFEAAYHLKKSNVLTGKFSNLINIDATRLGLGLKRTWRTGTDGLSQLKSDHLPFFEGHINYRNAHRFALKLERIKLDSGTLGDNAFVGNYPTIPQNYAFNPTNKLNAGIEPHFYYDFTDERRRYFAELGYTPTDGIVDSKPLWRMGMRHAGLKTTWDMTLFSTPVRQSILSYTGIVDPYTGQKWGRVMKTGLALSSAYRVQSNWTLSGGINVNQYKGRSVDDNKHASLSVSVNKIFTRYKRLDYLAIGPRLSIDQYDKNLGQFTIGHGGYFSPQKMIQAMFSAHALSKESYRYIFEADIALGYISYDEDAAAFFPLNEDGRFYSKSSASGFAMNVQLEIAWHLHNNWYTIGRTSYLRSKKYEESELLVGIRYVFNSRPALFSTDLPSTIFHKK